MGFWKKVLGSFSPSFYKKAVYEAGGGAVKYLFLFVLFVSLVLSTYFIFSWRIGTLKFLKEEKGNLQNILKEWTVPITIKDGKVSAEVEQPYVKEFGPYGQAFARPEGKAPEFVLVIDTKGDIVSLEGYRQGILLTENSLILQTQRQAETEIKKYDLSKIKSFSIKPGEGEDEYFVLSGGNREFQVTHESLKRWLRRLFLVGWPILFLSLYVFGLFSKFIQILGGSLYVLILNAAGPKKLKYANIFNLGVFAITVPTGIAVVYTLSGFRFAGFGFFYLLIYLLFITLGFVQAKKGLVEDEKIVEGHGLNGGSDA